MTLGSISYQDLTAGLDLIRQSPTDFGTLEMIVVRPEHDSRRTPGYVELSPELGVHGDWWADSEYGAMPEIQVTLINARLLHLVAGSRDRWSLAGDNLVVDFDITPESLPPGSELAIGSARLRISAEPHTGCVKFARRFGADALRFVNTGVGKDMRLRGVNASVDVGGIVSVGDDVRRV